MTGRERLAAATAAVAVCAGLGAVGYGLAQPSHHRPAAVVTTAGGGAVVPWVDRPAQPPPPPPSPTPPAPAYAACTAGQITARVAGGGAATGHQFTNVDLLDSGTTPCTLYGYPLTFAGVRPDGTRVALRPHHGTFADGDGYWPANLAPNQSAKLVIETTDMCADAAGPPSTGPAYVGEVIGLPSGGEVVAHAPFDPWCYLAVSQIGTPAPPPADSEDYAGLTASWDVPTSVPSGSLLHFTVTLTNHGTATVSLDPCPVYSMFIAGGRVHTLTYALNCDTVHAIAPGQAVTYAMQLQVPATAGSGKFGWSIPHSGVAVAALLRVT